MGNHLIPTDPGPSMNRVGAGAACFLLLSLFILPPGVRATLHMKWHPFSTGPRLVVV